jgi:uncharacterized alpha-E superfamily protein
VLSRIAEALYWTGRYTERAEDTARLLDVAQRAALEGAELSASGTLAAVLGGREIEGTQNEVISHYCLDRSASESVANSVRQARENARTIRDAVTSEMWESLNTWHLQVVATGPSDLIGGGAHTFLASMRTRAYLLMGCAEATMLRDEGWHWLALGRWLERLSFTCRLLQVRAQSLTPADGDDRRDSYEWAVLLRALSAYESYRTTYRSGLSPERVVEFLLLDRDFPRSARHAAIHVDESLAQVADDRVGASARRVAGRLRSMLDFRLTEEVLQEGLGPFVERIYVRCSEVHQALADEQFARTAVAAASVQGGIPGSAA